MDRTDLWCGTSPIWNPPRCSPFSRGMTRRLRAKWILKSAAGVSRRTRTRNMSSSRTSLRRTPFDSLALLVQIDGVLQQAGWKRMPPPHTFPEIEVFGGKPEYGVAVSLNAGIQVSTESQNPPTSRAPFSIFDQSISMHERAAGLLMLVFANKMFPPEEHADQKQLTVGPGTSQIVRIAIGRKP